MNKLLSAIVVLTLSGCSIFGATNTTEPCLGNSELPANLKNDFETVEDRQLLGEALGRPGKGKLCQGRVYQARQGSEVTIYRAWNSTNPDSKLGPWWAFALPAGKVSSYRSDYEICYQWSPLDMMVSCTLKPGAKVVVGTGQSAKCSDYLTYPVSDKQQVYIEDATISVVNCSLFEGEFRWK